MFQFFVLKRALSLIFRETCVLIIIGWLSYFYRWQPINKRLNWFELFLNYCLAHIIPSAFLEDAHANIVNARVDSYWIATWFTLKCHSSANCAHINSSTTCTILPMFTNKSQMNHLNRTFLLGMKAEQCEPKIGEFHQSPTSLTRMSPLIRECEKEKQNRQKKTINLEYAMEKM